MSPRVLTRPDAPSNLRPRQVEAFNAVFDHLSRGITKQLVMLPTGVGKTYLALATALQFERALFLVHRSELLEQTLASYGKVADRRNAGIIWGAKSAIGKHLTVAMVQTVYGRLMRLPPDLFPLIILDEAHHGMAKQWKDVLEHFKPLLRLGLSATPERLDGAPLSNLFDVISYQMTVRDAVREKALVRPKAMQVRTNIILDGIAKTSGDFNQKQLQKAINTKERNRIILDTYVKHGENRKSVAFTSGVQHARELETVFNKHGIRSISVAGNDPDREERVKAFERGEYQVIMNASLLTEGWDDPTIEAVLMCRPTQSRSLYMQAVGRGLRLHPGKTDCLILDFSDSSHRHRLVGPFDFFGARKRGTLDEPTDLEEAVNDFERTLDELRGTWRVETYLEMVDILQPPPDIDPFVLGTYRWHHQPATDKQLAAIRKLGYDTSLDWTRGQASAVIGREPASQQQLKLLLAMGFDTLGYDWTRNEASAALDKAKQQGKKPDWAIFDQLMQRAH